MGWYWDQPLPPLSWQAPGMVWHRCPLLLPLHPGWKTRAGRDVAAASKLVPEWALPFAEAWMIVVIPTTQPFPFLCSPYGSRTRMLCTRPWGSTDLPPAFPTPRSHSVQT